MTTEELQAWRNLAIAFGIVAVLLTLAVVLCREWVKNDLRDRGLFPLSVKWRPFAYAGLGLRCGFRVLYSDLKGLVHKRRCSTYWLRPNVRWEVDEIVGEISENTV